MRHVLTIAALVIATGAVFWPVRNFDFVNFDDAMYVYENDNVLVGLTPDSAWAVVADNDIAMWTPLTMFSYQMEVSLFGPDPGVMHMTNVVIHVINAVLVYVFFFWLTGAWGPSAFIAALFALHPAHVESVAWISERKDVLSTFFWLTTSLAYVAFARWRESRWMVATVVLFVAGLLSKPMLLTLPFALILLDIWPLDRLRSAAEVRGLLLEKAPLFAVAALFLIIAFVSQSEGTAVRTLEEIPFGWRLENAIVSFGLYVLRFFIPLDLSPYYPHPLGEISLLHAALVACALSAFTGVALFSANKAPYMATGWLFFLGTLVPVIGLLQLGGQANADRYTYVPYLGLCWIVAFGVHAVLESRPKSARVAVYIATACVLAFAGVLARQQVTIWRNSETLFAHALKTDPNNLFAHVMLGHHARTEGDYEVALDHYSTVLEEAPTNLFALSGMGLVYADQNKIEDALPYFESAAEAQGSSTSDYQRLAAAYHLQGRNTEAGAWYLRAIEMAAESGDAVAAEAFSGYASLLRAEGRTDEYENVVARGISAYPDDPALRFESGILAEASGKTEEARAAYAYAVAEMPEFHQAWTRLGVLLVGIGDIEAACASFERALILQPTNTGYRENAAKCRELLGDSVDSETIGTRSGPDSVPD